MASRIKAPLRRLAVFRLPRELLRAVLRLPFPARILRPVKWDISEEYYESQGCRTVKRYSYLYILHHALDDATFLLEEIDKIKVREYDEDDHRWRDLLNDVPVTIN